MTHWLVYLHKAFKAFKQLGGIIKDTYLQDKRNFIEGLTNWILQLAIVIWAIFSIVLPLPIVPKQVHLGSPIEFLLVTMKPFWLHMLALFGCAFLVSPRIRLFNIYTSAIFWSIIKVRNYVVFVKSGRDRKVTQ